MIKTILRKEQYRMRELDLNELNRYLQKIQQRLDAFGVGQDMDFLGKRIVKLGDAVEEKDAVNLNQLKDLILDSENQFYRHFIFFGG